MPKSFCAAAVIVSMLFLCVSIPMPIYAANDASLIVDLDFSGMSGTAIPNRIANGISGEVVDLGTGAGSALKVETDGIASLLLSPQPDNGKALLLANLPAMPQRTVEMWIKVTNATAMNGMLAIADKQGNCLSSYLYSGSAANPFQLYMTPGNQNYYDVQNTMYVDKWAHVVVCVDTDMSKPNVYINGVGLIFNTELSLAKFAAADIIVGAFTPSWNGTRWTAGATLYGNVAEVRVYNRIIPAAEVREKYNSTQINYVEGKDNAEITSVKVGDVTAAKKSAAVYATETEAITVPPISVTLEAAEIGATYEVTCPNGNSVPSAVQIEVTSADKKVTKAYTLNVTAKDFDYADIIKETDNLAVFKLTGVTAKPASTGVITAVYGADNQLLDCSVTPITSAVSGADITTNAVSGGASYAKIWAYSGEIGAFKPLTGEREIAISGTPAVKNIPSSVSGKFNYRFNGSKLVINGNVGVGKRVWINVFESDEDFSLTNMNEADYCDALVFVDMIPTNDAGNYQIEYNLPNGVSNQEYTIAVAIEAEAGTLSGKLFYATQADIAGAVGDFNAAQTKAELLAALSARALNVDFTGFNLIGEKYQNAVLDGMGSNYVDETAIQIDFSRLVAEQSLLEQKDLIAVSINGSQQPRDILAANKVLLGIDGCTPYWDDEAIADSVDAALRAADITDYAKFAAVFGDAVTVGEFKVINSGNYDLMWSKIQQYAVDLGVAEQLAEIKSNEQVSLSKKVIAGIGASITKSQLSALVSTSITAVIGERSGGGGGGSGGSSGVSTPKGGGSSGSTVHVPTNIVSAAAQDTAQFIDTESVPWALAAIDSLLMRGILAKSMNFRPGDNVTREEFAKMVAVAFGFTGGSSNFADVDADDWSYQYVSALYSAGIVKGIDAESFGAKAMISRQDAIVILERALAAKDIELVPVIDENAGDIALAADYAKDGIKKFYGAQIVKGRDGGRFEPDSSCTRAEMAVILYNLLQVTDKAVTE